MSENLICRSVGRRVGGKYELKVGGGDGKSKGGQEPSNRAGTQSKGGRTRKRGMSSDARILRRRKSIRYGQLKV